MTLLEEIQGDLVSLETPLSATLRKAKILAARLHSEELSKWVHAELNGYAEVEQVPEYRTIRTRLLADYIRRFEKGRNVPVPTSGAPNYVETYTFLGGVRELESLLESDTGTFYAPLPPEFCDAFGQSLGMVVQLRKQFTRGQLELVVDTIKNRLLDFLLEIESIDPDAGEKGKTKISPEQVGQAVNDIILGGYEVRVVGSFGDRDGHSSD